MPIYKEILTNLVDEGKITDEIRKWHLAEFIDFNLVVIGIF